MQHTKALIVGGGLSGLACARTLKARGMDFRLVEASESLGGRVKTVAADGFLFDEGFQVFNSAYARTAELLTGTGIRFHSFRSGALVRHQSAFHPLCDPFREPAYFLKTLVSPVGTFGDRLRILKLRRDALSPAPFPVRTTREELSARGFSGEMIERFFRPFLGGIFLESALETSTEAFQRVFRNFSHGVAQLPEGGMGEIPRAMAAPLDPSALLLGRRAVIVSGKVVTLEDGTEISSDAVVVALDADSLRALRPELSLPKTLSVTTHYFESDPVPELARFLVLGSGGAINTVADLASVSPGYAPPCRSLLSVTQLGAESGKEEVARELHAWLPGRTFRFLRTTVVRGALPEQRSPFPAFGEVGFIPCGDFFGPASIEGAVTSGIEVGRAVLN